MKKRPLFRITIFEISIIGGIPLVSIAIIILGSIFSGRDTGSTLRQTSQVSQQQTQAEEHVVDVTQSQETLLSEEPDATQPPPSISDYLSFRTIGLYLFLTLMFSTFHLWCRWWSSSRSTDEIGCLFGLLSLIGLVVVFTFVAIVVEIIGGWNPNHESMFPAPLPFWDIPFVPFLYWISFCTVLCFVGKRIANIIEKMIYSITGVALTPPYKDIFEAVKKGNKRDVAYFIKLGSDVNAKNNDGMTLLSCALKFNDLEVIQYLISCGANINDVNGPIMDYALINPHEEVRNWIMTVLLKIVCDSATAA